MGNHESIVTLGMRGDGDMAMTKETNIALLERIVADQREIIEEVTGKPVEETPQLWALYKEVQDYYDQGMQVPDDVTLLLSDDNWGNIRRLPDPDAAPRAGGYGIYYHFDYVGGPRNYKWLNTSPLPRVWEQMHLAYRHGVDRIWLVNVGDLKPMELPVSFFLDYAWNPDEWPVERLPEYTVNWAAEHFSRNIPANGFCWKVIPGLGRTLSAVTVFPVNATPVLPGENSLRLEYDLYLYQAGEVRVSLYLSPTLNYPGDEGLELAVSFDDQQPVVMNMHRDDSPATWNEWVSNNINKVVSELRLEAPGKHTLKIHMVDPGIVLQKIVVQTGKEKPSYLGEPESFSLD